MEKKVVFNESYCKSCGLCVHVCSAKVIFLADYINGNGYRPATVVDQEHCIGCMKCAHLCPDSVITIYKPQKNRQIV